MAFRGRGRGRGRGSRQYRTREDEKEGDLPPTSASEEGLRITVPNVSGDQAPALLYDEDVPIDKALLEGKDKNSKAPDKVPVKERLGQPPQDEEEESLRITVGNERFRDRPREPPQARLGPPVGDAKDNKVGGSDLKGNRNNRDKESRNERSWDRREREGLGRRERDDRDHRDRDDHYHRDRDDRRGREYRDKDFHLIRGDKGHGYRGHGHGGPDRDRIRDDHDRHKRDDRHLVHRSRSGSRDRSRDRSEDRGSRNSLDISRERRGDRPMDRDQRWSPGRDFRRSPGREYRRSPGREFRRSPGRQYRRSPGRDLGRSSERDPKRSPSDKFRRSPGRTSDKDLRRSPDSNFRRSPVRDFRRSGRSPDREYRRSPRREVDPDLRREDSWNRDQRFSSPASGTRPGTSSVERELLLQAEELLRGHSLASHTGQSFAGLAETSVAPPDTGHPLKSILKRAQTESVPSLPGAQVVDYGHGLKKSDEEIFQDIASRPVPQTLSDVLGVLRPPSPEKKIVDPALTEMPLDQVNVPTSHAPQVSCLDSGMDIEDEEKFLYGEDGNDVSFTKMDENSNSSESRSKLFEDPKLYIEPPKPEPYGKWDNDKYDHGIINVTKKSDSQQSLTDALMGNSVIPEKSLFPISTASDTNIPSSSLTESIPSSSEKVATSTTNSDTSTVAADPTIQNILKSIGFNFELSKLMQEKAQKEREKEEAKEESLDSYGINAGASFMDGGLKNVDLGSVFDNKKSSKESKKSKILGTAESYEEKARRYREELARAKARGQRSPIPFDEEDNDKNKDVRSKETRDGHHGRFEHPGEKGKMKDDISKFGLKADMDKDSEKRRPANDSSDTVRNPSTKPEVAFDELFSGRDVDYRHMASYMYSAAQDGYPAQGSQTAGYQLQPEHIPANTRFADYEGNYGYEPPGYAEFGELPPEAYSGFCGQEMPQGVSRIGNLTVIAPSEEPAPRRLSPEPEHKREIKIMKSESPKISSSSNSQTSSRTVLPPKGESDRKDHHKIDKVKREGSSSRHSRSPTYRDSPKHSERNRSSSSESRRDQRGRSSERPQPISESMKKKLLREREEREKRLKALERELEKLRKQQNEMMRKKQRQKDGHKDPLLLENSKLQDEISGQIKRLRKLAEENSKMLSEPQSSASSKMPHFKSSFKEMPVPKEESKPQQNFADEKSRQSEKSIHKKDVIEKEETKLRLKTEKEENFKEKAQTPQEKEVMKKPHEDKGSKETKAVKAKTSIRFEYFDPGNHWCRLCNHVSNNVYEVFGHVMSKKHIQKLDPYDRPWVPETLKKAKQSPRISSSAVAPLKGVEFIMSAQAFYCSLCKEFSGDMTCAEDHLKSETHNQKYQLYVDENPFYERRMQLDKAAGVAVLMREERKRSQDEDDLKESESKRHKMHEMTEPPKKKKVPTATLR